MTFTGVLLAGGESQRMGRDKTTVIFGGTPLWTRQLATLRGTRAERIVISARTDPPWRPNDVEFIADSGESHGPLSGLAAALAHITTTHLIALAIDVPMMTAGYLDSLGQLVGTGRGVVAQIGQRYEPLAAIYPREAELGLVDALAHSEFSLQKVLKALVESGRMGTVDVLAGDEQLFENLNEPSDLARVAT